MQSKLTFYYSPGACSIAVHVALEEAGIRGEMLELRAISLKDRAQDRPAFRSINPRGRIPALAIDGSVVTEVPALLVYVASLPGGGHLLPTAPSYEHAKCHEWLAWFNSTLHVAYAQFWRPERFVSREAVASSVEEGREYWRPDQFVIPDVHVNALKEQARENIRRHGEEIEQRIVGPWVTESFSLVDCYLLPFYRWGVRIGLPMQAAYPKWTAWKDAMLERPAVRAVIDREGIGYDWMPD